MPVVVFYIFMVASLLVSSHSYVALRSVCQGLNPRKTLAVVSEFTTFCAQTTLPVCSQCKDKNQPSGDRHRFPLMVTGFGTPCQPPFKLHCSLWLLLFLLQRDWICVLVSLFSQAPPTPDPFLHTDIFPNSYFACLIPFCMHLRKKKNLRLAKILPKDIWLVRGGFRTHLSPRLVIVLLIIEAIEWNIFYHFAEGLSY